MNWIQIRLLERMWLAKKVHVFELEKEKPTAALS
jgi:hypothetical protein